MTDHAETKIVTSRVMRVAQMTGFRQPFEVVECPIEAPRASGAVVRVEASGVCRSDWHFWNQDLGWLDFNLTLPANTGHEVAGVVEEVGCDVRTIKVGDRVTVPFHESEGTCPQCRAGFQNLCDHVIVPGVQRTGGWAQYVTVTAADLNCIKLADRGRCFVRSGARLSLYDSLPGSDRPGRRPPWPVDRGARRRQRRPFGGADRCGSGLVGGGDRCRRP